MSFIEKNGAKSENLNRKKNSGFAFIFVFQFLITHNYENRGKSRTTENESIHQT